MTYPALSSWPRWRHWHELCLVEQAVNPIRTRLVTLKTFVPLCASGHTYQVTCYCSWQVSWLGKTTDYFSLPVTSLLPFSTMIARRWGWSVQVSTSLISPYPVITVCSVFSNGFSPSRSRAMGNWEERNRKGKGEIVSKGMRDRFDQIGILKELFF